MILNSPMPVPERILLYGQPGTGKSRAALSVARILGPDQTMHVVDTDYSASYERLLWTEFTDVAEQGNVDVTVVDSDDWVSTITAVKEKAEAAEKGDWLVLDSVSPSWGALQAHFITLRHGDNFLDAFNRRGEATGVQTTDADINWQAVNAEYARLYKALFLSPAHVLLTAEADPIDDKRADQKIKQLYGLYGFKPKGQKALGHSTHTVLFAGRQRTGEYHISTVKDRGRDDLEKEPLNDFAKDYLMKVARWRPKPPKATPKATTPPNKTEQA